MDRRDQEQPDEGRDLPKRPRSVRLDPIYVASPKVSKTRSDIENRGEAENRREMETEQKQFKGAALSARKLEQVRAQNAGRGRTADSR